MLRAVGRLGGFSEVAALLEQCGAQFETYGIARGEVSPVRGGGESERWERRGGKGRVVEVIEQIGRDLLTQCIDFFGDQQGIDRRAVHQFQGPRPDARPWLGSAEALAVIDQAAEFQAGEQAAHVGEHFDRRHPNSLRA
jgi:hypothetical protein